MQADNRGDIDWLALQGRHKRRFVQTSERNVRYEFSIPFGPLTRVLLSSEGKELDFLKAFANWMLGGYTAVWGEGRSKEDENAEKALLLRTTAKDTERTEMYVEHIGLYIWDDLNQKTVWIEKTPTTLIKFSEITDSEPAVVGSPTDIFSLAEELNFDQDVRTLTLRNLVDRDLGVTKLAGLLGISRQHTFKNLTALRNDGYVKRERSLKGVLYSSTARGKFYLDSRLRIESAAICNQFLKRLKECTKIGRDGSVIIYENKKNLVKNLIEKITPELWELMDQDERLDFLRIQKRIFLAFYAAQ